MSSTQAANCANASVHTARNAASVGLLSANHAFIICSIPQAASPNSLRPTMRELPLSVWNARRNVVIWGMLPGSCDKARMADCPASTTSRASSRKISSSSWSSSDKTGATGAGTGAGGTGAAAGGAGGTTCSCTTTSATGRGTGTSADTSSATAIGAEASGCSGSSNGKATGSAAWGVASGALDKMTVVSNACAVA